MKPDSRSPVVLDPGTFPEEGAGMTVLVKRLFEHFGTDKGSG